MAIGVVEGSATIDTTEISVFTGTSTLTPQTTDCYLRGRINFSRLTLGDACVVTLYETVGGGSMRPIESWPVSGVRPTLFPVPVMMMTTGYQLTIRRTAGTARVVDWTLETDATPITAVDGNATVDTDEQSLVTLSESLVDQTDEVYLQAFVDPTAMGAGDRYRLRVTATVNGRPAAPLYETTLEGVQTKLWVCPVELIGSAWNVTAQLLAGTPRALRSSIRTDGRAATVVYPSYPAITNGTTADAIRDRAIVLVRAISPTYLPGTKFREYRNEGEGDFVDWADANPAGALRRYQIRHDGRERPPEVTNNDHEERRVTITTISAYPHNAKTGALQALDRDTAMSRDYDQLELAIGLYSRANFSSPNPDACWVTGDCQIVRGSACDFLVVVGVFTFRRSLL